MKSSSDKNEQKVNELMEAVKSHFLIKAMKISFIISALLSLVVSGIVTYHYVYLDLKSVEHANMLYMSFTAFFTIFLNTTCACSLILYLLILLLWNFWSVK